MTKDTEASSFKTDLQMIMGMLRYRQDKTKMLEYVYKHEEFFGSVDRETTHAIGAVLHSKKLVAIIENTKTDEKKEGDDVCKALDDLYNDGKTENSKETILDFLSEHGKVNDNLTEKLNAENDINVLKKWIKLSARVSSIEEFESLIN